MYCQAYPERFIPDRSFVNRIYQHKPDDLIGLAGLKDALNDDIKKDAMLGGNWGIVCGWTEESRYSAWDAINAAALISAIADPIHGVLQWLRKHY